jgi:SAM-dependent methyltransferase
MKAADFYNYQTVARGVRSGRDVEALVRSHAPIYNRILRPWMPEDKSARIYEVACGTGIFLRWARTAGWSAVTGSDIAAADVELARLSGAPVDQHDSLKALGDAPSESLDAIIAINFIEHIPKDVFMEFLSISYRVLRPGGRLIVRAPNGDSPLVGLNLFNDVTHVWAYTTTAYRSLAGMAGFESVEFKDDTLDSIQRRRWLKLPFMMAAQVFLRTLIRMAAHEDVRLLGSSYYACAFKRSNA